MNGRVLIVDDDADARDMLAAALRGAGYDTFVAGDGVEALERIADLAPDLVLMDAMMPRMDGFAACRLIKARPDFAERPVIFMTGLSETEHVVEGFRAGGVDYVAKPLVLTELLARIGVHLANARMTLSARSALDLTGRALLAADVDGLVLWQTSQAADLLAGVDLTSLAEALRAARRAGAGAATAIDVHGRAMTVSYIGSGGPENFYRLASVMAEREEDILKVALKLTGREADVLVWISRGKSNRDISEILNISARTVNKHLEQIFVKLGVENRAAAAVMATRIVAAR